MTGESRQPDGDDIDFERFFELAVDVMVVTRPDGRFERVNPALAEMLGVSREMIVASPWTQFVHPDDRNSSVDENTAEFEVAKRTMTFENRYVDATGGVHRLSWNAELDPHTGLVYGSARDVTEERAAQAALQEAHAAAEAAREAAEAAHAAADEANRAKTDFVSRMSHELRTPMNAVLGFAQLLELDDLDERQADAVAHILRAGRHLLGLIDEVLDIARIESGVITISTEAVLVADSVAEALSLLGVLARERGITLHSTINDPAAHVMADRQRLHQILVNFLSNAIKYTPQGGRARVESSTVEEDGWLRISVVDSGAGISNDLVHRLFSPFERLDAEHGPVTGTGLGLAHSKALAERMGGRVGVDSETGVGSSFWIELPLAAPAERSIIDERHIAGGYGSSARCGSVLCIDDNPTNMRLMERVFEFRPGVRLRSAMLGQLGLDLARHHRPDLIILDLHLPDMAGEVVLHHLRGDLITANIPVVVLSADASPTQAGNLLSLGAVAHLTKPVDIAELLATVDRYIGADEAGTRPGD
jgi:PAS domain S-box-containing protein